MDGGVIDTDKPKSVIPDGYESVDEFLTEMRERFTEACDADRENRDAGLEDLKFLAGDQWRPADLAARDAKSLPSLTINTLPQYVGQVVGDIRINRPSIKVRPAEDGDKRVAEVRQGIIRFIENKSNAQLVYALAGEDQVGGGLGHFRIALEYANDDSFDQDIRIKHIPDPFAVVWDPGAIDPTGADARYCFVIDEMDRATFEDSYPDSQPSTLEIPNGGVWVTRDTVKVAEYWVMKPKKRKIALVLKPPATQPAIVDVTGKEAEFEPFIVKGADGKPRVRDGMRWNACMYLTNGVELLDQQAYELPISRLPIIRVSGREIRVGPKRYRYGLVRFAKDPIRMKNLWRSSAAQWLGQAPKAQWLVNSADEEEADNIRDANKSGDTVIAYTGQVPPTRLDPASAPNALLQEAALADQDIKDVTGIQDASLGINGNETSGKAIIAREKQGDVATFMYHDNLHYAIKEGGRVVNELIPTVFDNARTAVVLGEDDSSTPTRVNDPTADEFVDLKTGKYDVVLEVGPSYSTKRAEAAESMMQFVQAVPTSAQFAGDLIAMAQDWPLAEQIGERMKKALPPGIAEEDEDDLTQEQMQAKQQAMQQAQMQQQMQQKAMELELAGAEAEVNYKNAQTAKMLSEAKAAQMPEGPQETDLDIAIKQAELRKANADAVRAEADADKAKAEAHRAKIGITSDVIDMQSAALDLEHKPAEQAMSHAQSEKALKEPPKAAPTKA